MSLDHTYIGRAYRHYGPESHDASEQAEHISGSFSVEAEGPFGAYVVLSNGEGDRWLVYPAEGQLEQA